MLPHWVDARERSVKIELERGVDRSCWCMSVNREGLSLCIPETLRARNVKVRSAFRKLEISSSVRACGAVYTWARIKRSNLVLYPPRRLQASEMGLATCLSRPLV